MKCERLRSVRVNVVCIESTDVARSYSPCPTKMHNMNRRNIVEKTNRETYTKHMPFVNYMLCSLILNFGQSNFVDYIFDAQISCNTIMVECAA